METPAPASCPGGTRPRVGSSACEPVGWTSTCPIGTTRDPSGFGCIDPAPPAACTGATREAYGETSCVPVGDCAAAFPPAGAIVVDATLGDAQLDETHFRAIADALAAAPSGATVAVESGAYDEALSITKPVTLVGRCAANVEIRSPAASTSPGIAVRAKGVTVRGVMLTGHVQGVAVPNTGDAVVEDIVVREPRFAGLYVEAGHLVVRRSKVENAHPQADRRGGFDLALGVSSDVTLEDTTLTGGVQGVLAGASATLAMTRVIITRQAPDPASKVRPSGIAAVGGAHVSVIQSVIRDLVGDGAVAVEDDSTVELDETVVRGIRIDGDDARGYGLFATYGGHLVVRRSMIAEIEGLALMSRDEGSSLQLTDSVVLGRKGTALPGPVPNDSRGAGLSVKGLATASLDGVAVVGAWGYGVASEANGNLEMKRSLIDAMRGRLGAEAAGSESAYCLAVTAAKGVVSDVSITRCASAGINVGSKGTLKGDHVFVRDVIEGAIPASGSGLAVGDAGNVDLEASVIDAATSAGVLITRGGNSLVRLAHSSVHGTRKARTGYGHGVTVRLDARIVLTGTSIVDNPNIGIAADGGRALVDGATVARNAVGIHAQAGSFLVEGADTDAESLGDGEVRVAPTTHFASNTTRVGSGVVPLPSPILP
jgi:hypothetical protein